MSVADAQRELTDARAVIVTSDTREFSDIVVVHRKWENVPLEQSQDYLDFLEVEPRSITDPAGCPSGTYRVLRNAYANEDGEREIHQYLAKDLHTTAPVTEADTAWRNLQSKLWKQSLNENVVLELRYCDPLEVQDIMDENADKTYTNNVYTENVGLLDGKWYSIHQTYTIDPTEGWATVHWYLAKYYNEDLIFTYFKNHDTRVIDFLKLHMVSSAIPEFQDTYYFSSNGHYYICDNPTTRAYTSNNGVAESGTLPEDAARVGDIVEGREVEMTESPHPDTNEITLKVKLTYGEESSATGPDNPLALMGKDPIIEYGEPLVVTKFVGSFTKVPLPSMTSLIGRYEDVSVAGDYSVGANPNQMGLYIVDTDTSRVLPQVADVGGKPSWSGGGYIIEFGGTYWSCATPLGLWRCVSVADLPPADGPWIIAAGTVTGDMYLTYDESSVADAVVQTGRRITVTRVDNARVDDGEFSYDLKEIMYTAPMLAGDGWFHQGSADLVERERRTFYSSTVDYWGAPGWQPGDPGPYIRLVELRTTRPKNVLKQRKYFVRRPTEDDLTAAGIPDLLTYGNTDPTETHTMDIRQHGQYLYSVEFVTITLGDKAVDTDAEPALNDAKYTGSADLTYVGSAPPSSSGTGDGAGTGE